MFQTEVKLVDVFISCFQSCSSLRATHNIVREFDYVSGRTDILSLNTENEIIAFEAKLTNWRKAIHQAWRNTSFANQVYVVLPRTRSSGAMKNKAEFDERGVGLCVVDDGGGVEVVIPCSRNKPLIPWLNRKAMDALVGNACFH
ncbi:MAG: hypothetical protein HZA03_01920 [Nitrospinae bacterium]|nr:hypothetical protein [Nitrospinota bacterium]